MLKRILPLVLLIIATHVHAQDSLFYMNGSAIAATVEEIGLKTVRYKTWSGENPIQVTVEKAELARIKLQNGQVFVLSGSAEPGSTQVERIRKNAIAFDALAPALNHFTLAYERVLTERASVEVKAGYIGLNQVKTYSQLFNSEGWLLKVGLKWRLPRTRARYAPPLTGWYLKPEINLSSWRQRSSYTDYYYPLPSTYDVDAQFTSAALLVNIGNQWLIGERITFGLFAGWGYGFQWTTGQRRERYNSYGYNEEPYSFSHAFFGRGTPLAVSGGMTFGFAF
ncbi:MAG: hypothetical protein WAT74_17670 [Flavobacteriales bacterium]